MIRQHYNPNQNGLCSINNVSENFAYCPSINHYRHHENHYITPVNEADESVNSDLYTEIRFDDEEESDQEMDFRKEFELFNEDSTPQIEHPSEQMEKISEDDSYSPVEYDKIFLAKTTLPDGTGIIKKLSDPSKELTEKPTTCSNEVDLNTEVICQEQLRDGSCLKKYSTHAIRKQQE